MCVCTISHEQVIFDPTKVQFERVGKGSSQKDLNTNLKITNIIEST